MKKVIVQKRTGDIPNGVYIDEASRTVKIDVTSRNANELFAKSLSPFHLGPVKCCDGLTAPNIEAAWQFSKIYDGMLTDEKPNDEFFVFRRYGWSKTAEYWNRPCHKKELRHPKGIAEPFYNCWRFGNDYELLGWVDARIRIYIPIYAQCVVKTEGFKQLQKWHDDGYDIMLYDFDGYDHASSRIKMSYYDVIHSTTRTMGHAFVIAMLLEGLITVNGDQVTLDQSLLSDGKEVVSDIMDL